MGKEEQPAVLTVTRTGCIGYRIDDAGKIEIDGIMYYRVELEGKRKKDAALIFSADGKLVPEMKF